MLYRNHKRRWLFLEDQLSLVGGCCEVTSVIIFWAMSSLISSLVAQGRVAYDASVILNMA